MIKIPVRIIFSQAANLVLLLIFVFQFSLIAQSKIVYAVRTETPPKIDGIINDSVWNKAIPISDFLQQEPVPGTNPTERTIVRLLYDDKNLYVSFMCYDDEPKKIIARELKLDGKWSGDDNIDIIFDTFNDHRHAYWFGTNPLGMRDDALLTSSVNFEGFNEDWNGVWYPSAAITDSGWSVEIVFPFSTFKFFDKEEQIWGVNFQRHIQRKGEEINWTAVGKDKRFFEINFAGELRGIKNIKRGNPIYLKPFFTIGGEQTDTTKSFVSKPGLDIKYGITETLSLDLTLNTDFAQVESDRARINLTRFPLFFPEKRDFFIEGAHLLSFSLGDNDNLFYSRRIGISNGNEIPLIAGAKLVGRLNNTEVGFLNIQTAEKAGEPTSNYSIARMKFDLFDQSYAGFFISNKISDYDYNRSFAGDIELRTNKFIDDKTLIFGANLAKTDERNGGKNSWAGKFYLDYPNDLIDQYLGYKFVQGNFNPGIGFISRTGIQQFLYQFTFSPRINWGDIKRLKFMPVDAEYYFDKDNNILTGKFSIEPFGFSTVQGDNIEFEINRYFDNVPEDFDIFENAVISAGKYGFTTFGFNYESASGRTIYGQVSGEIGNYYSGNIKSFSTEIVWSTNQHFSFTTDYSHNTIQLSQSHFSTNEIGARLRYDFSTMINSSVFGQWNNELNEININYRFNWQPNVGSNFYLVVNHLLSTEGALRTKDIAVLAKIVWQFIL